MKTLVCSSGVNATAKILLIAVLSVVSGLFGSTQSQAQGYDFSASSGTFTPLSGSTALPEVLIMDHVSDNPVPLGFTFNYFGIDYTEVRASSSGILNFNASEKNPYREPELGYVRDPVIAPLWGHVMYGRENSKASFKTEGTPGNRVFIFEWLFWRWNDIPAFSISFQARLHEGSNKIEFVYRPENNDRSVMGRSAIGLLRSYRKFYALANDNTASPSFDLLAVSASRSIPSSGQVYSFTPSSSGVQTPTIQASSITAVLDPSSPKLKIDWTNGNGAYRSVFVKEEPFDTNSEVPLTDGVYYKPSEKIDGWVCVYSGSGNSTATNNLLFRSGHKYRIQVIEYNGLAGNQKYLTSTIDTNPVNITTGIIKPSFAKTIISCDFLNSTTLTLRASMFNSNTVVFMKQADEVQKAPVTDGMTYTPNALYGAGSALEGGWFCVFQSDGIPSQENFRVSGLTPGTNYVVHAVDYNGPPGSGLYNNVDSNEANPIICKTMPPHSIGGFAFSKTTGAFSSITGGSRAYVDDKYATRTFPIGFDFEFQGIKVSSLEIHKNGYLNLGRLTHFPVENSTALVSMRPVIAGFWDGLITYENDVYYQLTGLAGKRVFTVEYLNFKWYDSPSRIIRASFQIKLYEQDMSIEYIYRRESPEFSLLGGDGSNGLAGASIGLFFFDENDFLSLNNGSPVAIASSTQITSDIKSFPETNQVFRFTPVRTTQEISFDPVPAKTWGDAKFKLSAIASSRFPVHFSTGSDKVSITKDSATILKPGQVTIAATQPGNFSYLEAVPVERTFCINPSKPLVTVSDLETEMPTLTSHSEEGNQWYRNDIPIQGASQKTLSVTESGVYSVRVTIDGCVSAASEGEAIMIMSSEALEKMPGLKVYPNPIENEFIVDLTALTSQGEAAYITLTDLTGKQIKTWKGQEKIHCNTQELKRGSYVVQIRLGHQTFTRKIVLR
jgi:hypothetical protein